MLIELSVTESCYARKSCFNSVWELYAISWRNCLPNWIILVGKSVILQVCLIGTFSKLSNIRQRNEKRFNNTLRLCYPSHF